MNLLENFRQSIRSIKGNLLRTILTAMIIAIGITSLVGILTAIDGIKASVSTSFSSLGANTFDVRRKRTDRTTQQGKQERIFTHLKYKEVAEFKETFTAGNTTLHVYLSGNAEIKRQSKKTNPNVNIRGIDENFMFIRDYTIEKGRNFTTLDIQNNSNLVLIGTEVVKGLFGKNEDPINQLISLYGNQFKVIGILKEKGGFGGDASADRTVFMPIGNAIRLSGRSDLNFIATVQSVDPARVEQTMGEATWQMRKIRRDALGDEDSFELSKNKTLEETLNEISGYLRIGGFVIGFVTLLGASIGLMNIMLVSVTERTREIGVRKALGATPKRIREQFLFEAIVICLIGGFTGVVLGIGIGNIISNLINAGTFVAPWQWVSIGLLVCIAVGVLSGYYPAYKASKLDPIESLRYE
ncbi:MAG: ABC transporter permease [Cyclobacteriaceae bacterium]